MPGVKFETTENVCVIIIIMIIKSMEMERWKKHTHIIQKS